METGIPAPASWWVDAASPPSNAVMAGKEGARAVWVIQADYERGRTCGKYVAGYGAYYALSGKERKAKRYRFLVPPASVILDWVEPERTDGGLSRPPPGAIQAGDEDGLPVWVVQAGCDEGTTCGKYLLDHGAFFAMKKREFRPSRFRFLVMKSGGPSNATSSHAGSVESTPRVTSRPEPELPTRDTQAGRAQAAGARLTPPSNALTTSTWSSSSSASVVLEGADTQDGGAVTSGATPGGSPRDTSGSKQVKWEPRNVTAGKSAGGGIDDDWGGSDYTSSKLQELEITLEIIQLERTACDLRLRRILQSGSGLSQCDQDSSASAAASTGGSRGEGAGLEGGMEGEQTCYKTAAPEPEEAISSDSLSDDEEGYTDDQPDYSAGPLHGNAGRRGGMGGTEDKKAAGSESDDQEGRVRRIQKLRRKLERLSQREQRLLFRIEQSQNQRRKPSPSSGRRPPPQLLHPRQHPYAHPYPHPHPHPHAHPRPKLNAPPLRMPYAHERPYSQPQVPHPGPYPALHPQYQPYPSPYSHHSHHSLPRGSGVGTHHYTYPSPNNPRWHHEQGSSGWGPSGSHHAPPCPVQTSHPPIPHFGIYVVDADQQHSNDQQHQDQHCPDQPVQQAPSSHDLDFDHGRWRGRSHRGKGRRGRSVPRWAHFGVGGRGRGKGSGRDLRELYATPRPRSLDDAELSSKPHGDSENDEEDGDPAPGRTLTGQTPSMQEFRKDYQNWRKGGAKGARTFGADPAISNRSNWKVEVKQVLAETREFVQNGFPPELRYILVDGNNLRGGGANQASREEIAQKVALLAMRLNAGRRESDLEKLNVILYFDGPPEDLTTIAVSPSSSHPDADTDSPIPQPPQLRSQPPSEVITASLMDRFLPMEESVSEERLSQLEDEREGGNPQGPVSEQAIPPGRPSATSGSGTTSSGKEDENNLDDSVKLVRERAISSPNFTCAIGDDVGAVQRRAHKLGLQRRLMAKRSSSIRSDITDEDNEPLPGDHPKLDTVLSVQSGGLQDLKDDHEGEKWEKSNMASKTRHMSLAQTGAVSWGDSGLLGQDEDIVKEIFRFKASQASAPATNKAYASPRAAQPSPSPNPAANRIAGVAGATALTAKSRKQGDLGMGNEDDGPWGGWRALGPFLRIRFCAFPLADDVIVRQATDFLGEELSMSSTLSSLRSSSPVSEVDVKESLEDQVASQLPSRGRCVVLCITSDKELQWRCLTCAGAHIMKAGPFLHLANPAVNPLSGVRDRPMGVLGTNTYPEVLDGGQLAVGARSLGAEQRHLQRKEIKEQQQRQGKQDCTHPQTAEEPAQQPPANTDHRGQATPQWHEQGRGDVPGDY